MLRIILMCLLRLIANTCHLSPRCLSYISRVDNILDFSSLDNVALVGQLAGLGRRA